MPNLFVGICKEQLGKVKIFLVSQAIECDCDRNFTVFVLNPKF